MHWRGVPRWAVAALLGLSGCSSQADGGLQADGGVLGGGDAGVAGPMGDGRCETGSIRCACYPNETCNGTLSCVSSVCVDLGVDRDASAAPSDAAIAPADGSVVVDAGDGGGAAGDAGDAGTGGDGGCTSEPADMIWLLDNSCSMAVESAAVQEGMNEFVTAFADRGVDVHLVLISSTMVAMGCACAPSDFNCQLICLTGTQATFGVCIDAPFGSGMCPDDSRPPDFLHLDVPVGSSDALQIALSQYPSYAHMMRAGVPKHFIVVSDDDSAMDAATFTSGVAALDQGVFDAFTFHGIYSFSQCPDAAAIGTVYDELVTQTAGVRGDLCGQDFPPIFQAIADAIESGAAADCP